MLLFVIVTVLVAGSLLYGVRFAQNALTVAGGAARTVMATRIFRILCGAVILGFVLPVAGGVIGISLGNVSSARTFIFISFMFSVAVFATIKLMAGFFVRVISIAYEGWPIDEIGDGIKYFALGMVMWDLFIMGILLSLGVYAYTEGILALLVGGLLYWSVSEYYGMPTVLFPKFAMGISYLLMAWFVVGSIPGPFWLGVGLPNLRPVINFWSTLDSEDLDKVERARRAFVRSACSRITVQMEGQYAESTSFTEASDIDKAFEAFKRACAKGDFERLQQLEVQYSTWHQGKAACLAEVGQLRKRLTFAPNAAERSRIVVLLAAKEAECPASP